VSDGSVTLEDIHRAQRLIHPLARRTPLLPSPSLSARTNANVRLKLETMQDTGAFKIRGATNKLRSLTPEEQARGVVAISSGNHGRGVAYAARHLGIKAIVCMGGLVPANKVENIKALGAEVRIVGSSQDEANIEAQRLIAEDGMIEAHPFDDPYVIAGQGTIGIEILEDMPEVDCVVVPLSGGGLIGGIAVALKAASRDIRVVGVSMERGAAMIECLKAGKPIFVEELSTLADALGGGIGLDNRLTFDLVRDLVDHTLTVSEDQIAAAMGHLFWVEQLVVEGAGAVGAAALLYDLVPDLGRNVAVVVSGRNVDMDDFVRIVTENRTTES
jgi:threonine dehydratase